MTKFIKIKVWMRSRYYGIVGKYGIPRFQLWLVLLFHRNIINYSRRSPRMQCNKKRKLVVVVPFSTEQSVFCDLQEFFRVSFQALKLTSTYVIWTLMLIIMYIQIIVVCYTLVVFFLAENISSINLEVHSARWRVRH